MLRANSTTCASSTPAAPPHPSTLRQAARCSGVSAGTQRWQGQSVQALAEAWEASGWAQVQVTGYSPRSDRYTAAAISGGTAFPIMRQASATLSGS